VKLLAKQPVKLVAVAVANKMARIAWAISLGSILSSGEACRSRGSAMGA
jgi:hypothetical protein